MFKNLFKAWKKPVSWRNEVVNGSSRSRRYAPSPPLRTLARPAREGDVSIVNTP